MAPGSEGAAVCLIAVPFLLLFVCMLLGILCWFAHLRSVGATLMFGAGGALVGLLVAGVPFFLVWYAMQPPPHRAFEQSIIRDWSHLDATPIDRQSPAHHPILPILGWLVPAAGLGGGCVGLRYAYRVARQEA